MLAQVLMWDFIALATAPIVAWLFLVWWRHPAVAFGFGIAISLFSFTTFGHPLFRLALVLPLIPHLGFAIVRKRRNGDHDLPSPAIPIVYVVICLLSAMWSISPNETLAGVSAWVVVLVFVLTFRHLLDLTTIARTSFWVFAVFVTSSTISLVLPFAWAGGRARGVFTNANSLGLACLFTLALALWLGFRYWIPLIAPLIGIILLTGSRASFLAAAVLITLALLPALRPAYRWLLAFAATVLAYPTIGWLSAQVIEPEESDVSVFRTNNSRSEVWLEMIDIIEDNTWLGVGYDAGPPVIANSFLKLLGEFGVLMSFGGVALTIAFLVWSRHDQTILAFSIAACTNAVFEDWLLTAGSPFLLTFLMLTMAVKPAPDAPAETIGENDASPESAADEQDSTRFVSAAPREDLVRSR